jgi:regulator of protease activity HflC (stomatin/prohibitin superfamily)
VGWWIALGVVVGVVVIYVAASVKVVNEYERGVVFLFGRVRALRQPGLHFVPAVAERMVRVSLQTTTIDIPARELITSDSVTVQVNAVAWYRVLDPVKALVEVQDYTFAVAELANATLLSALREVPLDSLLRHREEIQERLTAMVDATTEPWGMVVTLVEVRDVLLPESMRRAMAREAEAERERRAKVVSARGELEAATALNEAAALLEQHHSAIRLRELATLLEISAEKNSTIIFPLPVELLRLADAATDLMGARHDVALAGSSPPSAGPPVDGPRPTNGTGTPEPAAATNA